VLGRLVAVDPRCVPNPVQVHALLDGVREQGRVGRRPVAFYRGVGGPPPRCLRHVSGASSPTAGGGILSPTVELLEYALIAYFVPPYNEKLTEWRAEAPTRPMRQMSEAGFRLLKVHLNGVDGLARFYSRQVPQASRSHLVIHDLPTGDRRVVPRGISTTRLSPRRAAILGVDPDRS
jgi:hypothetical protein